MTNPPHALARLATLLALVGCSDPICDDVEEGQRFSVEVVAEAPMPEGYKLPEERDLTIPSCKPLADLRTGDKFTISIDGIRRLTNLDCRSAYGHIEENKIGNGITLGSTDAAGATSDPSLSFGRVGVVQGCEGAWAIGFERHGTVTPDNVMVRVFQPLVDTPSCASIPVGGVAEFARCRDAFVVKTRKL